MLTSASGRSAQIDDEIRTPVGINVTVGAVTIGGAALAAGWVPAGDPQWRCAVVAVAVGLFAACTIDWRAVAVIVLPTWMIMNGFLVNPLGDLSWHGWADFDRFLALVAAACLGLAIGASRQAIERYRHRWQLGLAVENLRADINEETKRRA